MSNINFHRINERSGEAVRITIHTLNDFLFRYLIKYRSMGAGCSLLSCAHRRNGDVSPNEELLFLLLLH